MPKLLEIKSRIERLPQLQKQQRNNARVVAFKKRVETSFCDIKECVLHRDCCRVVFPGVKLKKTVEAVKQSKLQAQRLIEKLKADFDAIELTETDKKITRIGERNAEAKDEIKKLWRKQIEEEFRPLLPLVEIVGEASLPGHEGISAHMKRLQDISATPPITTEKAAEIRSGLDSLKASLAELELEGPGGEFLKKAVKGTANPKEVLKKEVREFLDEKELWDILTIRVG